MEFKNLDVESFYRVLAPRPTIIVTTVNEKGEVNAAPFSFTMPVSVNPPLIAVASVARHHTYQNLEETQEFVVNIPTADILNELWVTGEKFPQGVSEIEKAELTEMNSLEVTPPWIKECVAHMECNVEFTRECGDHQLVVGRVLKVGVREDALKEGLLDVESVNPILHLGGKDFVVGDHRRQVD
ncbi:flavin reductase family protein [uncultured Methanobacterium sp.]|uniref:flavin reductase family protein n=1 Tax=uncultured Methanobacterium sp. TaxID=176306 RepID=UPI002AA81410|nr:flavin reductase family protein [uncultured Methanobacterium sp.]